MTRAARFRAGAVALVWLSLVAAGAPVVAHADPAPPPGTAVPATPLLSVETASTALGDVAVVRLEGWPDAATVTVSLCGNDAVRASLDCDLAGAQVAVIRPGQASFVRVPVQRPPVDCPCVLRGATSRGDVVRTVPIEVPGVPLLAPDERLPDPAARTAARDLEVGAEVVDRTSGLEVVEAALGLGGARALVLHVHNRGRDPVRRVVPTAVVGRSAGDGTPVHLPVLDAVQPGEERTVEVPLSLDSPSYGTYVVSGRVTGADAPVAFSGSVTVVPWGWLLVGVVAVAGVALLVVRRRRGELGRGSAWHDGSTTTTGPAGETLVTSA